MKKMIIILIVALTLIQVLLLLAHWFLFRSLIFYLGLSDANLILFLKWFLIILSFSFVVSSVLISRYDHPIFRVFYTIASIWLGLMFLLLLASFFSWLAFIIADIFHLSFSVKIASLVFYSIALILSVHSIYNAYNVKVTEIRVALPNLPADWKGRTAVWVSDVHLGAIHNYKFSQYISGMVNGLKPDVVFLGGDLYDGVKADLDKLAEPFSQLHPPQGIYFITGNHEEFGDKTIYVNAIKNAGIKVLDNEMVDLAGLQIIGVDYTDSRVADKFKTILDNIKFNRQRPTILLRHEPTNLQIASVEGINFVLSGHTHDGQLWPLNYIVYSVYRGFGVGFGKLNEMQVFTSTGAGTWGPPLRLGNRSEIVRITFD